jgi:hypothetical protein
MLGIGGPSRQKPDQRSWNARFCGPASDVEWAAIPKHLLPILQALSYGSNYSLAADCPDRFRLGKKQTKPKQTFGKQKAEISKQKLKAET